MNRDYNGFKRFTVVYYERSMGGKYVLKTPPIRKPHGHQSECISLGVLCTSGTPKLEMTHEEIVCYLQQRAAEIKKQTEENCRIRTQRITKKFGGREEINRRISSHEIPEGLRKFYISYSRTEPEVEPITNQTTEEYNSIMRLLLLIEPESETIKNYYGGLQHAGLLEKDSMKF